MRIKIGGETLIAISMYLVIYYLCLPISMIFLNSFLIHLLVIVSAVMFVVGLVLLNKYDYLIYFCFLIAILFLFCQLTWGNLIKPEGYIYYCFASLSVVFGGIVLYYCRNYNLVRRLFLFLTLVYFVTAVTSIIGLSIYPNAARELGRGSTYDMSLDFDSYKTLYRRSNIASWGQICGMLFAIPSSIMIWSNCKKPFYILMVFILFLTMIASQVTFAVLLALVAFFLIFATNKGNSRLILVIFGVLFLILNLDPILSFAIDLSEKASLGFLTAKLSDLKSLLLYNNVVGDAEARYNLYSMSLKSFFNHPLFGLLFSSDGTYMDIGYHSELFDLLGALGSLGLFVIISAFICYSRFVSRINSNCKRFMIIILLEFSMLFVINPVFHSPQIFVGAFLYPILSCKYCSFSIDSNKEQFERDMLNFS